jgi:hypothetical protein
MPVKIEIEYKELLDVVYALRARADVFERMPSPAEGASGGPDHWKLEAAHHRGLADRLLAQVQTVRCDETESRLDAMDSRDNEQLTTPPPRAVGA